MLDFGDQNYFFQPLDLNPPSRGLDTEIPKTVSMGKQWEDLFLIKLRVEY